VASAPFATSYRWHENSNTPHKPCPLSLGNLSPRGAPTTMLQTQTLWHYRPDGVYPGRTNRIVPSETTFSERQFWREKHELSSVRTASPRRALRCCWRITCHL